MDLFTEIIGIFGEKTKENLENLAKGIKLYPKDTKRIVRKHFFFPEKVLGKRVGWLNTLIIEQTAEIQLSTRGINNKHYNTWVNTKILEQKADSFKSNNAYFFKYSKDYSRNSRLF